MFYKVHVIDCVAFITILMIGVKKSEIKLRVICYFNWYSINPSHSHER